MKSKSVPFNRPSIGLCEYLSVLKVLKSRWISKGQVTKKFESAFAKYQGVDADRVISTNSCTSALHLALILEGIKPGDEVIVPAITFPATANVVEHVGATPVFVDAEDQTLNLDVTKVEGLITEKTRAIIPVHLYGNPCDLFSLRKICDEHDLVMIQDCAHAVESLLSYLPLHIFGDYCAYSFYATKNLTTAEGGMLISPNPQVAERAEILSLHGLTKDAWKRYQNVKYQPWDLEAPGYKYNMTDIQAALGLCQLRKIETMWKRRREVCEIYISELKSNPIVKLLYLDNPDNRHAYHLFPVIFETETSRQDIIFELEKRGVNVGVHFPALPLTKYYREKYRYIPDDFTIASHVADHLISLPLFPDIKDSEVFQVINAIKDITEVMK